MAILAILNPLDDDEFLRLARDLAGQAGPPEALQIPPAAVLSRCCRPGPAI